MEGFDLASLEEAACAKRLLAERKVVTGPQVSGRECLIALPPGPRMSGSAGQEVFAGFLS